MKPLLIAHRGDTVNFPENTIEAFQSAFRYGADGIEFDIHCHENGDLVVVHNYTHNLELKYPLLEDVLYEFSMKGRLEIEIKAIEERCVQRISRMLHRLQPSNIEITSSELPLISVIRKYFPDSNVGLIFNTKLIENWMPPAHINRMLLGYMKLTEANILHLDLDYYSKDIVRLMHENDYLTHTHLHDADIVRYEKALDLGIDQCSFDDIALLSLV